MDEVKEAFKKFHKENPKVYNRLLELTKEAHDRGRTRIGMRMLFEVVRWNEILETSDPDFKLNNNYTGFYARMIMHLHPEFGEIFELRQMKHSDMGSKPKVSSMFPNVEVSDNLPDDVQAVVAEKSVSERGTGRKAVVVIK